MIGVLNEKQRFANGILTTLILFSTPGKSITYEIFVNNIWNICYGIFVMSNILRPSELSVRLN